MPPILQFIGQLLPLTHFIIILRGIVIKGVPVSMLLPQVLYLLGFAVVLLGLAGRRFKKSLD
jgi:ABC-2 type transport system permease protein